LLYIIYGVPWIPSIYPLRVSIYTSMGFIYVNQFVKYVKRQSIITLSLHDS
jgi:hypothetical protein